MTNLSMVGLRVEVARDTFAHVKKTLPPSLNTFPGEAEIKYYVKTTVVRPQFYKENIRSVSPFAAQSSDSAAKYNRLQDSTSSLSNPREMPTQTKKHTPDVNTNS